MKRRAWYWRWRLRGVEPPACLSCGGELEPRVLPVVIARTRSFEMRAEQLPYRSCSSGCSDRRAAAPRFPDAVLGAVLGGGVPVARLDGAGDWHCGRCSSRQWSPVRRLATVEGRIEIAGAPPFTLAVTGPTCICDACGTVQLRSTPMTTRELTATLADLWRAAGLRHRFR